MFKGMLKGAFMQGQWGMRERESFAGREGRMYEKAKITRFR
jgi:hypothetical protein